MRIHRTSVLVLLLVVATSVAGFGLARSARDDNEARLLALQAGELGSLFTSIGTQYQTTISAASSVAEKSAGNPDDFTAFVRPIQRSQGGNWYLLHRDPAGLSVKAAVGTDAPPVLDVNHSPQVDALLDQAFTGKFVVVGIFGTGVSRTLALAGGTPDGATGDITYVEFSLLAAAASSASSASSEQQSNPLADLDMAVYIGPIAPENLLFASTPSMHGRRAVQQLTIGSATVNIEVAANKALSGSTTANLPWILLAVGLIAGSVVFVTTELTLRRRDNAVAAAAELVTKNVELDQVLAARQALEDNVSRSREELIQRLAWAADFKDPETASHLRRMSLYCEMLGRLAGLDEAVCEQLRLAAPMHDIGKIGIPDDVLTKPGRYTAEDREVMMRHPLIGYRILAGSDSELVEMAARVALHHHEWFDGSGYPSGVSGTDIPMEGRIVAIADVFDALTTKRRYKPAMSVDEAFTTMIGEAGHFDPALLALFMNARADIEAIRAEFGDEPSSDLPHDELVGADSVLGVRS